MEDSIFVVTMLKSPAKLSVTSGNNSQDFEAMSGINAFSIPMGVGPQKFEASREAKVFLSGTSMKDIVDTCVCGIYNFNAYVGTIPSSSGIDSLQPDGLALLSQGLRAPCPTNTLV
jgi:hypothetical protein